jgi:hypothetical protein
LLVVNLRRKTSESVTGYLDAESSIVYVPTKNCHIGYVRLWMYGILLVMANVFGDMIGMELRN